MTLFTFILIAGLGVVMWLCVKVMLSGAVTMSEFEKEMCVCGHMRSDHIREEACFMGRCLCLRFKKADQ